MKYLGIDFGSKNIGLAISDSSGLVAMPFSVVENNNRSVELILNLVEEKEIDGIVFGWSKDLSGTENSIQKEVNNFIQDLKRQQKKLEKKLEIFLQDERFTSMESKWGTVKDIRRSQKKSKKNQRNIQQKIIDDKAATLILQSFLDKNKI